MTQRPELKEYLEKHVQVPLGDLLQMQKIVVDIDNKFDCSIPMAMVIISSLELIGYLLNDQSQNHESDDNIRNAITSEASIFTNEYTDRLNDIIFYFRHGMMHGFFPQAINKRVIKPNLAIKKLNTSVKLFEGDTLNVIRLHNDFIKFIDFLKSKNSIISGINPHIEVSHSIERK